MVVKKLTPFQQHVQKWKDCKLCDSCNHRTKVVFLRGSVPCDVLFVGEAPGPSEDVLGKPFIGPAGKLLDSIVEQAWFTRTNDGKYRLDADLSWAFTNLVSCIPKGDDLKKFGEPPVESIKTCSERLAECVSLCDPQLIVCVGKLSEKWMRMYTGRKIVDIVHPAAILRADFSQRGLMIKRSIITLADAVEDL